MTGQGTKADMLHAVKTNAIDFLEKPFDFDEFIKKVMALLEIETEEVSSLDKEEFIPFPASLFIKHLELKQIRTK